VQHCQHYIAEHKSPGDFPDIAGVAILALETAGVAKSRFAYKLERNPRH